MNEIAPSIPNTVQAALVQSTRTNTVYDSRDTLKPHFRRWFFQRNGGTEVQKSVPNTPAKEDESGQDGLCPLQASCVPLATATPIISKVRKNIIGHIAPFPSHRSHSHEKIAHTKLVITFYRSLQFQPYHRKDISMQ